MIISYCIIGAFGLALGSFLGVLILRSGDKSAYFGRSKCPKCDTLLRPFDLLPVVSFIGLRGQCRYCREKISFFYPLIEILTAISMILVFWAASQIAVSLPGLIFYFSYFAIVAAILILIGFTDFFTAKIPNRLLLGALVVIVIFSLASQFIFSSALSSWMVLLGGGCGAGFLGLLALASNERWMGMGDAKLAAVVGLFLGYPKVFVFLSSSFVLGSIIGIGMIVIKKRTRRDAINFGAIMAAAAILTLAFGDYLIKWYLGSWF